MTSNPLFINVLESMVIFGPIAQVGWARAWSTVTAARSPAERPRNGPPLAVSTMRVTSRIDPSAKPADDRRHWCTAQCSLSTGTSSAPGVARSGCTTGPAAMRLSLFASPRRLPDRSVSIVTGSPANPTTPLMTTSASDTRSAWSATTSTPGSAAATSRRLASSATATTAGRNSRAWATIAATDEPAPSATTS